MTVSVEDIDRWDAGDVREVFHATRSRAEAAFEAADGIAQLPAFGSWGGEAAAAAKDAIDESRASLNAHGAEAMAVSQAASRAAEEIEQVKSDLAQLRADAESLGMEVNAATSTVVPGPSLAGAPPMEIELKQAQLQTRLNQILADAAAADLSLTQAINTATGASDLPNGEGGDVPQTLTGAELLDELKQANDKSVLAAIDRVRAAKDAYDKAASDAYVYGQGSPEGAAALAQLPKLKQDLATALDDLGKIPDYAGIDPASLRVDADGNVFFRYPFNGQLAEVSGSLKNGTGQLFDKGRLAYFTYENGQLVGTRFLDEGRAIASAEPLFTAVTTAVGVGPMVKGGEGAWLGLRGLFGGEGAAAGMGVTSDNVIPRALELAAARAESAGGQLAAGGPGAWGAVTESMSARAAAYQVQITGHPITEGYIVNGVKFDGLTNGVLTDAKGYYAQFIENGQWKPWFTGEQGLLDQAQRQINVAGGTPIRWVFAEPEAASLVERILQSRGYSGIEIVVQAPK